MTGAQLKQKFEIQADVPYSGYWDTTKLNVEFLRAYTNVMQGIYLNRLSNQNAYDEMSYLIVLDKIIATDSGVNTLFTTGVTATIVGLTYAAGTNPVVTVTTSIPNDLLVGMTITISGVTASGGSNLPAQLNGLSWIVSGVSSPTSFTFTKAGVALTGTYTASSGAFIPTYRVNDYLHYLFAAATFTQPTPYSITDSTNTSTIKITLDKRSPFRSGDQVIITGIGGNTNVNGTRYLKQANDFDYYLYSDATLLLPVAGNGTQTGVGAISKVWVSVLKNKSFDQKGNLFGEPTPDSPYYQQMERYMRFYPLTVPCSSLTLDYVRKPPFNIDVADAVLDWSTYFPLSFQYEIVTEACRLFAGSTRDGALEQVSTEQFIQNP